MQTIEHPEYLTCQEVARALGFSKRSVERWVRAGRLKAIRPGGKHGAMRIAREEIERLRVSA